MSKNIEGFGDLTLNVNTTAPIEPERLADVAQFFEKEALMPGSSGQFLYSRYHNPTVSAVEKMFAHLAYREGAFAQLVPAGMAAIDTAVAAVIDKEFPRRPLLMANDMYGGTIKWRDEVVEGLWGMKTITVDIINATADAVTRDMVDTIERRGPGVILVESISNPRLAVLDIAAIAAAANRVGATLIVDNTIATPLLVEPIRLGAHLSVYSATKSLSGLGSVTAGLIIGRSDTPAMLPQACARRGTDGTLEAAVRNHTKTVGAILSPRDAFELASQLRTVRLRVPAQNANALRLARWLNEHTKVSRVYYPGLADDPGFALAARQFDGRGFGSLVTVDLREEGSALRVLEALSRAGVLCRTTLGDVDTTVLSALEVFGAGRFGDHPDMIRISVGAEPYEAIEAAFAEALEA